MMKQRSALKADLEKYYIIGYGTARPTLIQRIQIRIFHFGLHCVACYRFGHYARDLYSKSKLLGFIPKLLHLILSYFVHMIHHVDIDAATIGYGLYIGHVGTIYIGPSVIGNNFSLTHNVTIGLGHSEHSEGVPNIGNDVWIGTGSIISGAIEIGNRVTIASGCILSRSVPDGSLVGGNPGRVILRDYDNRKLFGQTLSDESDP